MTRFLPFPVLAAGLLAMWLLLNQTLSLGQILLGSVIALAGSWGLMALQPPGARFGRLGAILELAVRVLADIVRSNIAVARIILTPGELQHVSGFVRIPLDMRNPYGLATLACIITATPGTLWVSFDSAEGIVVIHVLDLIDEAAWVETIKGRYESRLLEIFE